MIIDRLLVIGVGLIGGSLSLALRKAGAVREIVGAGRNENNLKRAIELGVIDRYSLNFADEVPSSDVVVIATPMLAMDSIFETIVSTNYRDSIITDVGSAKTLLEELSDRYLDSSFTGFVPAHPIAGRECSGVEAASENLFENMRTIITPTARSSSHAIEKVRDMWAATGCVIDEMDVQSHDEILAATSHLPHVAAFALVNYIANHQDNRECFQMAAGGFYDFTRIASSDPVMWRDICSANASLILQELNGYIDNLQQISACISSGNIDEIEQIFRNAKSSRDENLKLDSHQQP
ncbi:MAG: prephenate dehydrogenase/arogenate dehydrogenase family protein [Acidiferrobacterales bacterium]|nr:prephenate dehydrogenase/arogenate dehydrogenase family protein [Acidiferrobacterales bacterium]